MGKPSARQSAVAAITSWSLEGRRTLPNDVPVRQLFGANVFSDEVMRARLP